MNPYTYALSNPMGLIDPWGLCVVNRIGHWLGTGFGAEAALWYAQRYNDTGAWYYALGGAFASLWTPETYVQTTLTLVSAGMLGAEVAAAKTTAEAGRIALRAAFEEVTGIPGGICFTAGTLVITSRNGPTPIEELKVGQRVVTLGDQDNNATEVDPETWRLIRLTMPNPDGSRDIISIETLRPLEWIESTGAEVGEWIEFGLPEMGLFGKAHVQEITEISPIENTIGRVILSTVTHLNGYVYRLEFDDSNEVLELTDKHRLFSIDRNDWIQARSLIVGERLRTVSEDVKLSSIERLLGVHQVFNIEVETDHSYLVTDLGILSHNVNPCAQPPILKTNVITEPRRLLQAPKKTKYKYGPKRFWERGEKEIEKIRKKRFNASEMLKKLETREKMLKMGTRDVSEEIQKIKHGNEVFDELERSQQSDAFMDVWSDLTSKIIKTLKKRKK